MDECNLPIDVQNFLRSHRIKQEKNMGTDRDIVKNLLENFGISFKEEDGIEEVVHKHGLKETVRRNFIMVTCSSGKIVCFAFRPNGSFLWLEAA